MKGQGFLGWSDEKMRRMWLGREIVVADLNLPSPNQTRPNRWKTKKINPFLFVLLIRFTGPSNLLLCLNMSYQLDIKRTVGVISSASSCKYANARFTTGPLNLNLIKLKNVEDIVVFHT